MKRILSGVFALVISALFAACSGTAQTTGTDGERAGRRGIVRSETSLPHGTALTIYRSPTCSCCKEYEAYLAAAGVEVNIVEIADVSAKKAELGVPDAARSCHTSQLGDYVIEGHVPIEVLAKLLDEKPALSGIGLPGMPAGAPGMGTPKEGPLHIVSFDEGGTLAHYATV